MHGDIALVECANSIREFMHLVSLGVNFPTNKYGEFVGYKTDNDPKQRATSVGPLTSKEMGQALLRRVRDLGIIIHDKTYIFKILDVGRKKLVLGLKIENLTRQIESIETLFREYITIYQVDNLIAATGGSSLIYTNTVYPESQKGSLGFLIEYGCEVQNLTESQFGLASTEFRWNVSGTYQQVIPTYVSCKKGDSLDNTTEFLNKHFPSPSKLLNAIFLKGYQWPFNSERIDKYGSSLIDILVYEEMQNGYNVYLDFSKNPCNLSTGKILKSLLKSHANYLIQTGIDSSGKFDTPVNRLRHINPQAYDLYRSHQIDLEHDLLAISVCAQHCNGGISGDIWWESNKSNIFVIGEANGSHGVHRPGGAALNSGQVGGLRASLKIVHDYYSNQLTHKSNSRNQLLVVLQKYIEDYLQPLFEEKQEKILSSEILSEIQHRVAKYGTIIRTSNDLQLNLHDIDSRITSFVEIVPPPRTIQDLLFSFRVYDALITHGAYLQSINQYLSQNGGSRGSYLVKRDGNVIPRNKKLDEYTIKTIWDTNKFNTYFEKRRPIPCEKNWFETVWQEYQRGTLYKEK
jgi:succinate dehydrogenase/fumarate reductase flavoprotein subunit